MPTGVPVGAPISLVTAPFNASAPPEKYDANLVGMGDDNMAATIPVCGTNGRCQDRNNILTRMDSAMARQSERGSG